MAANKKLTKIVQWCRERANEKAAEVYYTRESQAAEIAYDHVADELEERREQIEASIRKDERDRIVSLLSDKLIPADEIDNDTWRIINDVIDEIERVK